MKSGGFLESNVLTEKEQYEEKCTLMKKEHFSAILSRFGFKSAKEVYSIKSAVENK